MGQNRHLINIQTEEISNASSTEKKEHDNNFKKFEKVILQ